MAGHLLKNCAAVIVDEGNGPTVRRNVDLLTDGPAIRARLGVCPQGHEVLRFRRPKNMGKLSCAQCAPRFDRRYLISWRERSAAELAADRVA